MSDPKIDLLGFDLEALTQVIVDLGEKPFRAQQIFKWIHQEQEIDFERMTNLSKSFRQTLVERCTIGQMPLKTEQKAKDGTRKWLFTIEGGGAIETVYIPEANRATLCISSQVGCALNCQFCHTAVQGFQRDLSASEIIGQLWQAVHLLKQEGDSSIKPITNVVMMGMGEPLLNFKNVVSALKIMLHDLAYGLSKRRVTLSTSGVVPAIDKLKAECDVALAVSLHAPTDLIRSQIVPLNKKYPIATLLEACQRYVGDDKRTKITMEYVMLAGVNDQVEHARALVRVLEKVPAKVNLIPFNPYPGAKYQCSDENTMERFQRTLMNAGIITMRRKTRGEDILAACGQLAGNVKDKTTRSLKFKRTMEQQALHTAPV